MFVFYAHFSCENEKNVVILRSFLKNNPIKNKKSRQNYGKYQI